MRDFKVGDKVIYDDGKFPHKAEVVTGVFYTDGNYKIVVDYNYNGERIELAVNISKVKHAKPQPWNGEGFPPVGVECVFTPDNTMWGFNFVEDFTGKVLHYEGEQFVFMIHHQTYKLEDSNIVISRTDKGEFRPIETPEQKAEREIEEACIYLVKKAPNPLGGSWGNFPDSVRENYRWIVKETSFRKPE
ncbi:hypothetical protein NVP1123O_51 [Vibrio phage 1.123.O._10N.286.48.F3]|nr:hypothetical protein NVP1123O_51 [Vibrio phage 1.123.O._10N.286.48.F3]